MKCLELAIPPLPSLLTVGRAVWAPGSRHQTRSFDAYDLILVKKGAMYMREDDTEYVIQDGQLLLLEPGRIHSGTQACSEPTAVYWVHFRHPEPLRRMEAEDIPWSAVLPQGQDSDEHPAEQTMYLPKFGDAPFHLLQPLLDRMVELHRGFAVEQSLKLQVLFCDLLELLQADLGRRPGSRSAALARETVSYLQRSWNEPFRSEELEEALHFQFDHITRCLKKYTGMTPLQYVQHLRISQAMVLLEQTSLTVQEVAEQVGIPSASFFGRLFRDRTGISPGQYRQRRQSHL